MEPKMYACLHCLSEETVRLKIDRKNRPYTTCCVCGTRAFMPTNIALRGVKFASDGQGIRAIKEVLGYVDSPQDVAVREALAEARAAVE